METHLCRNRVHLIKQPQFGHYTVCGGKTSYTLTPPYTADLCGGIFSTTPPTSGLPTVHCGSRQQKQSCRYTQTERFLSHFTAPPTGAWLRSVQNTDMSWLKMTQSARLYGAVSTFNDRGGFVFQAGEEQDGTGASDWQSTKDKHKPVKSGANYLCLIYSLPALNQSFLVWPQTYSELF